jgi:putative peptidoglycan lipid II flippase
LAVLLATVTYPMLARSVLAGDTAGGRARMEWDLRVVSAIVLAATAYVVAFASPLIEVLFEHGAFTATDTSVTAAIMRVYTLGLLGQAGVAVLSRAYFSGGRPGWQPTLVMGAGLAVTAVVSMALAPAWHGVGIAAGNAAGITVTAIAFLHGARQRMGVGVAAVGPAVARLGLAAAGAGGCGWALSHLMARAPATLTLVVGFPVVCAAFVIVGTLARADEVRRLVAAARPATGARGAVAGARGAVAESRGAAAGWLGAAAGRLRSAWGRVRDGT